LDAKHAAAVRASSLQAVVCAQGGIWIQAHALAASHESFVVSALLGQGTACVHATPFHAQARTPPSDPDAKEHSCAF
jgi:hypothetical protein